MASERRYYRHKGCRYNTIKPVSNPFAWPHFDAGKPALCAACHTLLAEYAQHPTLGWEPVAVLPLAEEERLQRLAVALEDDAVADVAAKFCGYLVGAHTHEFWGAALRKAMEGRKHDQRLQAAHGASEFRRLGARVERGGHDRGGADAS